MRLLLIFVNVQATYYIRFGASAAIGQVGEQHAYIIRQQQQKMRPPQRLRLFIAIITYKVPLWEVPRGVAQDQNNTRIKSCIPV